MAYLKVPLLFLKLPDRGACLLHLTPAQIIVELLNISEHD